jgi:ribokinase
MTIGAGLPSDRPPAAVVVVGSLNRDTTLDVGHLPLPGETILAAGVRSALGGKGANQAVGAVRQGVPTAFICAVGEDVESSALLDALAAEGLDLTFSRRLPGVLSGQAFITVDAVGDNTVVVAPGANASLVAADVSAAAAVISRAAVVLTQLEIPIEVVGATLRTARAAGAVTILNPAPARPLDRDLLAQCDFLVPNETEATVLSGQGDPAEAAEALGAMAPAATVIVTCGAGGVVVRPPGGPAVIVSAVPVVAVDSVAAGDAFCGVLAAALAEHRPLMDAVNRAAAAGAHAVTVAGAVPSLPTAADVEALLRG